MKLKSIGVASFVTIALVFSACSKNKEARPANAATPTKANVSIPVPPSTQVIQPSASSSASLIEGTWWTNCVEEGGRVIARKLVLKNDVLSFGIYAYGNDRDLCDYDLTGEDGKLENTFYTRFALVAIQDGVMTHRVDYIAQNDVVEQAFVIRIESDKKQFLASRLEFLTSRDTSAYYGTYYKY